MPQFRLEDVDNAVWQWIAEFLTNPQELEQGMADYEAEQEVQNERIIERLAIIDELLADHQAQLGRVLDLYLEGDFPKELLVEKKTRLEDTIRSLENEKLDLIDFIERRSLTREQYDELQEFSKKILEGINMISCDYQTKRQIVDLLDIQVVCTIDEEGNRLVNLKCILGSDQYGLSTGTHDQSVDGSAGWRGLHHLS